MLPFICSPICLCLLIASIASTVVSAYVAPHLRARLHQFHKVCLRSGVCIDFNVNGNVPDPEIILGQLLASSDKRHMVVVDGGANRGDTIAAVLASANPNVEIHAFEPHPVNFRHLMGRFSEDRRIKLYQAGLGATSGKLRFIVSEWNRTKGDNLPTGMAGYLAAKFVARCPDDGKKCVTLPVVTLDETLSQHVDVLKVDVQGMEPEVFKGAIGLIKHFGMDVILTEFSPSLMPQYHDGQQYLQLLEAMGYYLVVLKGIKYDRSIKKFIKFDVGLGHGNMTYRNFSSGFKRTGAWTDLLCIHHRVL